jgi:hypothetical protein
VRLSSRCRALLPCGIASLALLSGCSLIEPVQPWEKQYLSKPEMTFEADKLEAKYMEHIFFSKEAASGGAGVGGGGCGCN